MRQVWWARWLLCAVVMVTTSCGDSDDRDTGPRVMEPAPTASVTSAPAPPTTSKDAAQPSCPAPGAVPAGLSRGRVTSQGLEREYLRYLPTAYDGTRPVPVVLNFHGYGSAAEQQLFYGDFRALAEADGFVVIAPQGQGRVRHFNFLGERADEADDVVFTLDLLDQLGKELCIDRQRVYAAGMSNGGVMSAILACRAADDIAAVGVVAAVVRPRGCAGRPVPVVAFAGTDDPVVPFAGGRVRCCGNPQIPPAEESMARWAAENGCDPGASDERVGSSVVRRTWSGCDAPVTFYIVDGGGHTWPGAAIPVPLAGVTTQDIDASETLWRFFSAHSSLSSSPSSPS